MQGDRVRGNAGDEDFINRFFQDVQTGDSQDAVHVTTDNDFEDDG